MEVLQIIWFGLLGVLVVVFAILGGFDLGVGILVGGSKSRSFRDRAMSEIAPFWDGNQVWLITAVGALFAAFPKAYSAALSNLYVPVTLFLLALILRVVSIEFFLSLKSEKWRAIWSRLCGLGSAATTFFFGAMLGSLFIGNALDGNISSLSKICAPFSLCVGVLFFVFSAAQGATYLAVKNSGDANSIMKAKIWIFVLSACLLAYVACFVKFGISNYFPRVLPLGVLLVSYVPLSAAQRFLRKSMTKTALVSTSLFALLCVLAHILAGYPYIISPSQTSVGVDILVSSSSVKTLWIMLVVALVGVPLALSYFVYSHIAFGKKK